MKLFGKITLTALFLLTFLIPVIAFGEDYYCEVMSVQGEASVMDPAGLEKPLQSGDLLKVGDTVKVGEGSHLDLAYDKGWNNVSRIWEKSEVKIQSLYPTGLWMKHGDVLAKLHKLPAKSTFEIETPTAVAAVRGSAYRTTFRDGVTEVFNLHSSNVEVHIKDVEGTMEREATILKEHEKTEVRELGEPASPPQKMTEQEVRQHTEGSVELDKTVEMVTEEGRIGKIQEMAVVERQYQEDFERRIETLKTGIADVPAESRTTDVLRQDTPILQEGSLEKIALTDRIERVEDVAERVVEKVEAETVRVEQKTELNQIRLDSDRERKLRLLEEERRTLSGNI